MQKITRLIIRNYRSCKDLDLQLDSFTPLVGQNNAGKSTILNAIRIILNPEKITLDDFHDSDNQLEIIARFVGVSDCLIEKIPEAKHRTAIKPYCPNGTLWIRVFADPQKKLQQEVWSYTSGVEIEDIPSEWSKYPTGLPQAVKALFPEPIYIHAMKDLGKDLSSCTAGTTIKRLLEELAKPITETCKAELGAALNTINTLLTGSEGNRAHEIDRFGSSATQALSEFFPGLEIRLTLPEVQLKEFFKSGAIDVKESSTGEWGDFRRLGSGAQRAIEIALLRVLAESGRSGDDDPSCILLLIDEPEMYLHPSGITKLRETLKRLAKLSGRFQIVFSTHSPIMLCRESAAHTVRIHKPEKETKCHKPLVSAVQSAIEGAPSQSRLLFEIGRLGEIYFSKKVVLCEGKTDDRLLPVAYEAYFERSSDSDGVAFLALGGSGDSLKAKNILETMGIEVTCLCDFDFALSNQASELGTSKIKAEFKPILKKLSSSVGFQLNAQDFPQKCSNWKVADIWHEAATSTDGIALAQKAHEQCLAKGVWIWKTGTIEDVIGVSEKGEKAIISHESELAKMTRSRIESEMPVLSEYFIWLSAVPVPDN
tara:strand:+ start:462 stop:2249 length:1788 start_codon:yes stop_codon:yes gene_type:complete